MRDLIEREDAIHAFDDCGFCSHGYLVDVLKGLPSAQPQRKKGKWVSNGVEAFGVVEYWVCDQCYAQSKYRSNFCPSCGADMRGEIDE